MYRPRPMRRTIGGVLALAADAIRLLVSFDRFSRKSVWFLSLATGSIAMLAGCPSGPSDSGGETDASMGAECASGGSCDCAGGASGACGETGVADTGRAGRDGSDTSAPTTADSGGVDEGADGSEADERSGPEPVWRMRHNDVPDEAKKDFDDRDRETLQQQLIDRGWTDPNYHVKDGLIYSSEHAKEGSHALGFYFSEADAAEDDDRMGAVVKKVIDRDEAWVQFWLKFEEGFDVTDDDFKGGVDWADGGKITGWGDGVDRECDSCRGIDGWTGLITFHDPEDAGYTPHNESGRILLNHYVYHADNTGYGDTFPWTENDAGVLESGRWYEITVHAVMNDVGKANGVLEAWVDGTKAYERRNWTFREEGHDDMNIGVWRHGSWFGGGWYPPKAQAIYTDDLRMYTENPLAGDGD